MSPIWSSSESPISVRTIWVDGVRHAILNHDDPILTRQRSSQPSMPSTKSNSYPIKYVGKPKSSDRCFVNFHVVVHKKDVKVERKHVIRRQSAPIRRIETSKSLNLELNGILHMGGNKKTDSDRSSPVRYMEKIEDLNYNYMSNDLDRNCVMISNVLEHIHDSNEHSNPLSERVLQWMDLSGCAKTHSEKKQIHNKNDKKNCKSVVQAKVCSFRRQNSAVFRDVVTAQHYKLSGKKSEDSITEVESENNENLIEELKIDVSEGTSNDFQSRKSSQSGWTPLDKPQLHIFMPDIDSSREDTSAQHSTIQDETLEQNIMN
ncbi:uncharacterized protein LOC135164339 [Diachasmimorpha longicaudata]|uniref:uncharacterized protein LOC135164339 n=1 Tax=Diachasmimorpha longicaudata TaxID=58733 RepID=UPI0030B8E940